MFKNRKNLPIAPLLLVAIFIIFGVYYYAKNGQVWFEGNDNKSLPITTDGSQKTIGCVRTTRLENAPQYDRALSLIRQRVDENNKWWNKYGEKEDGRFKYFPPELVNCIKISEEDIKDAPEVEGYFIFNSEDIKTDYYPITVSSDYRYADDIVTAILLSHEMTHVQQYIKSVNEKDSLSCIDKEIEAFRAQLDFYVLLNNEENSSVYHRIQSDKNLHPELQMLDAMMTINRDSNCKFDKSCTDANLLSKLRAMLIDDSYYKKQCKL